MFLGIYGAGGLGREIFGFASWIKENSQRWDGLFFIDDADPNHLREGLHAIAFKETQEKYSTDELEIAIGIGEPSLRELLSDRVQEAGYKLASLIHPRASLSAEMVIEQGVIINSDKVTISPGVIIRKNVLIQPFVSIGHDTEIGENSVISAFSALAGNCRIGRNVYVAMQTAIREKVTIGDNCIIGMGAIVARNVPENYTVFNKNTRMVPHEPGTRVFK